MAMASSHNPATDNRVDEQLPTGFLHVNALSKSTPQSSDSAANKRKREPVVANLNTNEETKPARVADIGRTEEKHVVETSDVKEVEMKDAESISVDQSQSVKEVEMQDAEVAPNETGVDEKGPEIAARNEVEEKGTEIDNNEKTVSNLGSNEEDKNVEESESSEGQRNDVETGQRNVLGEVATLLKQVEESDSKAKLEVEVKVKKLEEDGEVKGEDPDHVSGRVSCP